MADLKDCQVSRRSIRSFTEEKLAREMLEELLSRAILAPSASNRQPWFFVVVDDSALIKKIKDFSPGLGGDPACIVAFCLDTQLLPKTRDGGLDKSSAVLDLGMAAQNFMLAAVEQGLGTCVVKSIHPRFVAQILRIPSQYSLEFVLTVGVPAKVPEMPQRRNLESIVHYNAWSED